MEIRYDAIPIKPIDIAPNGGREEMIKVLMSLELKRNMKPIPVTVKFFHVPRCY